MTIPIKILKKQTLKTKPIQKEVWDKIADKWEAYVVKKIPVVERFLREKKGLVIDLGCGNGRNMLKLKGIKYYGVDFSKEMIKNTRKYVKAENINANLFVNRVDKLDKKIFKNKMFDYGLFISTLHCLETKKQREDSLKELYRILKKDSEALISVWNSDDKRFYKIKGDVYMSWKKERKDLMRYYYLYNKEEIINLLEKVGFKILDFYETGESRFSKKNWVFKVKKPK
jgi:ubiquinone/menaquinone biosynthesis C-methylase UbiE